MLAINASVDLSKEQKRVYFKAFQGFSIEAVEEAIGKVLETWEYNRMPTIAVILKHLKGTTQAVEDKALVMAHEIAAHLKAYGSGKFPDLHGDKIAHHLMTRRWPYREWGSQVLDSEMHWWVKEFSEAYRSYSETDLPLKIEAPDEVLQLTEGIG